MLLKLNLQLVLINELSVFINEDIKKTGCIINTTSYYNRSASKHDGHKTMETGNGVHLNCG